jgi:4-amino-4-deoxy-L-arabinose transferase-like glycosyltransferase
MGGAAGDASRQDNRLKHLTAQGQSESLVLSRPGRNSSVWDLPDHRQQLADVMSRFNRMAQWLIGVDRVAVASAVTLAGDHAGVFQVSDDGLHGPFGNADRCGNIPEPHLRIARQANQHVGMIR